MGLFPTGFVSKIEVIEEGIGERGNNSITNLREKGYTVGLGLTEYYAGAIAVTASQKHILEYCPKDSTDSRFGTLESTEKWLTKGGGRATFLLLKGVNHNSKLAGYGWTGLEPCAYLPDYPVTSAYRIGELALGQGLAKDFVQIVVSGTNKLYAPGQGIGLETWASNKAEKIYRSVGFLLINRSEFEYRPTYLNEDFSVMDQRLYMGYQSSLLEK